jgi:TRAP-type uncharacterized transport system substrate-binding protein
MAMGLWGSRLLRREWTLSLAAVALGLVALGFLYLSRPTPLKVAVGPAGSQEERLLRAFADALATGKRGLTLAIQPQAGVGDSAASLRQGTADLAVVRTDVALPENGLTVAILREEALVVAAPEASGVKTFGDLARRRLGIVALHGADLPLVTGLLAFYDLAPAPAGAALPPGSSGLPPTGSGLPPGTTALVPLRLDEVTAALDAKRVDAVAIVAAPSGREARDLVRAVEAGSRDRKAAIVAIEDGEAIAQRLPALGNVAIPAGIFGGRPRRPAEEVKTIGVSYRLMARDNLSRNLVASTTQNLFEMRGRLLAVTPAANLLKAPDFDSAVTATSARVPNHPGAVDYFQREQLTFFQQYGDYIYLLAFFGGSIASGVVWLWQRVARKRRELLDVILDRLMEILGQARDGTSVTGLDELAMEIDGLVTHAVRYARHRTTDARAMTALTLAIDSARAAISDRRRSLLDRRAGLDDPAPADAPRPERARPAAE